jgi:CIC family chloride channel protein
VLGGGYGWIQEAIDGQLAASTMLLLSLAHLAAFALTISSGGSGGVFAPTLYVGAMLGGCLAQLFNMPVAAFAVVGMAAVFGAAAQVPLATLLMVTEMTGGYHLLVPAALAVMSSYFIKGRLSSRLEYKSLYEAQVPTRADSPAHRTEQVETAFRLLRDKQFSMPPPASHIDLQNLLSHGVAIDLPDGRRMLLAGISQESPWTGKTVGQCFPSGAYPDETELVTILREGHLVAPRADLQLMQGDKLVVIATDQGLELLKGPLAIC